MIVTTEGVPTTSIAEPNKTGVSYRFSRRAFQALSRNPTDPAVGGRCGIAWKGENIRLDGGPWVARVPGVGDVGPQLKIPRHKKSCHDGEQKANIGLCSKHV